MTTSDPLSDAIQEWVERAIAGEDLDPESFAEEKGIPAEELLPRLETARWLVDKHRFAQGDSQPGVLEETGPGGESPLGVAVGEFASIGRYRPLKELGRGGQAVVYLAEDTLLHRKVALKLLTGLGALSERALTRLQREAEVTSRLDHPSICAIYDSGLEEGTPYIAMRFVEGETLAHMIAVARKRKRRKQVQTPMVALPSTQGEDSSSRKGKSSSGGRGDEMSRVLHLIEKIARALHAAHENGVLHRDIKPGNIMVTPEGDPVVLDFGLAADLAGDLPTLTLSGDLLGTPAYMSAEQLVMPADQLDRRTDVYSLGATLYECLTLSRPFEAPTREGLYEAIRTKEPADACRLNSAIGSDLKVVLATVLEKDRNRRYASALDFAEDLRRVRSFETILARPAGPVLRLQRWTQRNPLLALSSALLFLFLAGGLALTTYLLGEARRERDQKELALVEWNRLADLKRLKDLKTTWSERLWPAEPERVGGLLGMDAWIKEAKGLKARGPQHKEALSKLSQRAVNYAEEEAPAESSAKPPESTILEFTDPADGVRYEALTELSFLLDGLDAEIRKMEERREFALSVDQVTIEDRRKEWDETIAYAADGTSNPQYEGLVLEPQRGLVPIGADPDSKLLEFAHLQTGEIPTRDRATGKLQITERTGLVFVLLPGGTFWMGASREEASPNYDSHADSYELPAHKVELDPFLLSKYEMTQGQWLRIMEKNPSLYNPESTFKTQFKFNLLHPVESVSGLDCEEMLRRLGLVLPTEAQWEYACRAGTSMVWHTGDTAQSLKGFANIADEGSKRYFPPGWRFEPGFRDGHFVHAPVGTYSPNEFGFHDMHGNVAEWCRDWPAKYAIGVAPGDGLRLAPAINSELRILRGGSFAQGTLSVRSAHRKYDACDVGSNTFGVRPARNVNR